MVFRMAAWSSDAVTRKPYPLGRDRGRDLLSRTLLGPGDHDRSDDARQDGHDRDAAAGAEDHQHRERVLSQHVLEKPRYPLVVGAAVGGRLGEGHEHAGLRFRAVILLFRRDRPRISSDSRTNSREPLRLEPAAPTPRGSGP